MATASQVTKTNVLNSWKEIANYLGRGVRTVQRYEHDLGLPIRRPSGKSRSSVIALTEELDEWLRRTPPSALNSTSAKTALPQVVTALHGSLRQQDSLRQLCQDLRNANVEALRTLTGTIRQMQELLQLTRQATAELAGAREHTEVPHSLPNQTNRKLN